MTIRELSEKSGKCLMSIYKHKWRIGRVPTLEEVMSVKVGRPKTKK